MPITGTKTLLLSKCVNQVFRYWFIYWYNYANITAKFFLEKRNWSYPKQGQHLLQSSKLHLSLGHWNISLRPCPLGSCFWFNKFTSNRPTNICTTDTPACGLVLLLLLLERNWARMVSLRKQVYIQIIFHK